MNRNETRDLLKRRLDLTGDNFGESMLDTWHAELIEVDMGAAVVALRRAATKHGHVRWFDFHAELDAHLRDRTDRHQAEPLDCQLCGGTGWKDAGPDRAGNTSVEPCHDHIRPGPYIDPAAGMGVALLACEAEMRRRDKPSHEIDLVLNRWFGEQT